MIGYAYYFNNLTVRDCTSESSLTFNTTNELYLGDFIGFTPTKDNIAKVTYEGTNTWNGNMSITENTIKHIFSCIKIANFTLSDKTIKAGSSMCKNAFNLTIDNCTVNSGGFYNFGNLTIESGTFNCIIENGTSDYPNGNITILDGTFNAEVKNYDTLVIENGSFNRKITNSGSLTILDGIFNNDFSTGNNYCVENKANANLIIKNGSFTSGRDYTIYSQGTLVIENGSFSNTREGDNFDKWCIYVAGGFLTLKNYTIMESSTKNGSKTNFVYVITNAKYKLGNETEFTNKSVAGDINVSECKINAN